MLGLSRALVAFAVASTLTLSGCGSAGGDGGLGPQPARTPLPTPSPVGLETPTAGEIYLGAYANATHSSSDLTTLESQIGRTLALDMHYDTWTTNFPAGAEDSDLTAGRFPVDSWNCNPTNAQIVAGFADPLIQTRALAIKNYGRPVFLRFLWDMNTATSNLSRGSCYDASRDNSDGTFSASEFVASWQHIRAIFAQEKVTNVVWVWCPSASGSNPIPYYPGDSEVDWVGIDAYDTTGTGFAATISPIYTAMSRFNKPILVAETGELAAEQASFFQNAGTTLQTSFPLIRGFMYYDAVSPTQDWRLTPAGITGFAALAAEPYFLATHAP
jgi:hypothetical protein